MKPEKSNTEWSREDEIKYLNFLISGYTREKAAEMIARTHIAASHWFTKRGLKHAILNSMIREGKTAEAILAFAKRKEGPGRGNWRRKDNGHAAAPPRTVRQSPPCSARYCRNLRL